MIKLTNRLKYIYDLIDEKYIVADIGSDHGYLPLALLMDKKIKEVILTDVNKMPLNSLKENIKKYKFDKDIKIQTRLGNGLEVFEDNEVDIFIIAGMGGILIKDIINKSIDISKSSKKIILQPMNNVDVLRNYLVNNNFNIGSEKIVKEKDKLYQIILIDNTKDVDNNLIQANILSDVLGYKMIIDDDYLLFLDKQKGKYKKILNSINDNKGDKVLNKIEFINKLLDEINRREYDSKRYL